MIFQRGNPLDYERWAADPGMEAWDYAHCLPYFKRMETCLAGADDWRGGDGPLVLERGPADQPAVRRVLRGRAAGRLPAHRRRQRLPAGGLRAVRPQRPPRPPALAPPAPTCTRCADRKNLTVETLALATGVLFEGKRAVGVDYRAAAGGDARGRRRRGDPLRRRDQLPAAAAALRRRRRARSTRSASPVVTDLPGVGENLQDHLEVYIQYASKQPVSIAPGLTLAQPAEDRLRVAVPPQGARRHQPLRGRRLRPQQRRRRLPQPDVPLPADRDPVRRLAPGEGHGYQVHIGPMYSDARGTVKINSTDPREHPALRFNYLSTEHDRASGSRRSGWPATSSTSRRSRRTTTASSRPGPSVETDEEILDWVAPTPRPRCTRRAPPGWATDDDVGRRPAHHAGARRRRPAGRRRLGRSRTSPTATSTPR